MGSQLRLYGSIAKAKNVPKKMIETNGGRIELKSKPGEGSTFKIFFRSEFSEQSDRCITGSGCNALKLEIIEKVG